MREDLAIAVANGVEGFGLAFTIEPKALVVRRIVPIDHASNLSSNMQCADLLPPVAQRFSRCRALSSDVMGRACAA